MRGIKMNRVAAGSFFNASQTMFSKLKCRAPKQLFSVINTNQRRNSLKSVPETIEL